MMKKYLFLAIFCLVSMHCFAESDKTDTEEDEAPKLDISGSATVSSNFGTPSVKYYDGTNKPEQIKTEQKSNTESTKDSSLTRIVAGEAALVFKARGKLKNGWRYGATLELDAMKGDTGIDKMYIEFERDNFGTVHAGNVKGPEATFLCGGQQLIGGTCGMDGVFAKDLDFATGVISPSYVVGYTSKASKAVYYTPEMHGFQFGVAVTPDTKHVGHDAKDASSGSSGIGNDNGLFMKGDNDSETPSGRNNIALGLTHGHSFENGFGTKISAVYLMENTHPIHTDCYVGDVVAGSGKENEEGYVATSKSIKRDLNLRNARAWHTTASVSYKNFTVGVGYLNNGKSRLPVDSAFSEGNSVVLPGGFMTAKDGNAGQAWNIGMKYKYEKWIFSGVYHNSNRKVTAGQKTRGNMYTVAVDYVFCPGLKVFVEIDYVISNSCDYACALHNLVRAKKTAIKRQRSTLFVLGAIVSF